MTAKSKKKVVVWRGGVPIQVKNYYEAARPDKRRKQRKETGSADVAVNRAGMNIVQQARHLDQNHDLARGALNNLVKNTVGHTGIQIEPQPRTRDGKIHKECARILRAALADWARKPEVTHQKSWSQVQRMAARTLYRDGEFFSQRLRGRVRQLNHGTRVPYSIELIEPDYVPMDYSTFNHTGGTNRVVHGIEMNDWGQYTRIFVYKEHPNDLLYSVTSNDLKAVDADRIDHVKLTDRIKQTRGVSLFASVMTRLDDIKDYEESERVAAKVAASMAAYIRKGAPDDYSDELDDDGEFMPRDMRFRAGMIFDDLLPGEEIGTIDTNRPNTNLENFRNSQMRAFAAGFGGTFSAIAMTYNGTYSAQRQELVEGYGAFQILSNEFTDQFVRPNYEAMIETGVMTGTIQIPADVDLATINDAMFIAPEMPWIDPYKEAVAFEKLEENMHASGPEIVRKRGKNPDDVLEQEAAWREAKEDRGLMPSTTENTDTGEQNNARAFLLQD